MIIDEELELEDLTQPDTLPQAIIDWQPERGHLFDVPRLSMGFVAAAAVGVVAVGALALGALAIGRLTVGRARFDRLDVDELTVRKLKVLER